jgi:hypothetical protein
MVLTVIVEPDPNGHRFQWVQHVVKALVGEGGEIVLLTSTGGSLTEEFKTFLSEFDITVIERFADIYPPAAEMGRAIVEVHRERPVHRYVIMDSDQIIKRWWLVAPKELRAHRGAPVGVLLMTRFPPRILLDGHLLWLRTTKSLLTVLAMARGRARRMAYIAGRDQGRQGLLFRRLRDPAICTEHASRRSELREELGLPPDRHLVGILGKIDERKNVPMVGDAVLAAGPDVDLLLAGAVSGDVPAWLDALSPADRARIHVRDAFHSDPELDAFTASCDIVAIAQLNPGPSGVMGKAQVAGVPVLSAGSHARRREVTALASGVHAEMSVEGIAAGIRELLARGPAPVPAPPGLPTGEEFGAIVLEGARPLSRIVPRRDR